MKVFEHSAYLADVESVAQEKLPWEKLQNKTIIISGASGLIGSCFIDVIMKKNQEGLCCKVYAICRNLDKAHERFSCYDGKMLELISFDINRPLDILQGSRVDFVIHLASNTHPVLYSTEPISTITTNVFGTYNMLEFALQHGSERCVIASSNEIYGENRGDVESFDEEYCGYINSNTLRAGYPESKRCSEALCQAYFSQKKLDIVIPRFTRSYGPTMKFDDTKAISQFIRNGVRGEDIVLKSKGLQYYSYTYVSDAVSGLLTVLLLGHSGEAYNISDEGSDIMLKDLAAIIADYTGKQVVFELPDEVEAAGFSKATKARIDGTRIKNLGWKAQYEIKAGIQRTIDVLKCIS